MNKNQTKVFGIQRTAFFNGKRRVGLDTNILIKLYSQPSLFDYEQARIFNHKDTVFTHKISVWELSQYIIRTKRISEEGARKEAKEFVKSKNIEAIYVPISQEEARNFEREVNQKFQSEGKITLKCHPPDSIILLGFRKRGINKIISDDESFRESAKHLGIDTERLPSLDMQVSKQLRFIFNKGKKFYKKKR